MLLCVFGYLHCQVTYFTIFICASPSVEITQGVFLTPETFHEKFFRKFFQNYPKRLFPDFLARICDEGKGCLLPAHRGGYPLFVGLWACCRSASLAPFLSFLTCSGSSFRSLLSCLVGCFVPLLPCGLPFLGPASVLALIPREPEDLTTGQRAQNRLKRVKN